MLLLRWQTIRIFNMSKKLIPRKIKKACKDYRNDAPLKTKWLRYVRNQIVAGRIDVTDDFTTKYGSLIAEYIDYGKIL